MINLSKLVLRVRHTVFGLVVAVCGSKQETRAVQAACEELPTRVARAFNLAQSGKLILPGVEPTPEELSALQVMMGVALVGKEVSAAYEAMSDAETRWSSAEGKRFAEALASLKSALAAGVPT